MPYKISVSPQHWVGNLRYVFPNSIDMVDKELIQVALGLSSSWFVKCMKTDTSKNFQ